MDHAEMVAFVRRYGMAVVGTRGPDGTARTAEYPIAITDAAEFVFEISVFSQKYANLVAFSQVALVVGVPGAVTVQAEGVADVLTGAERDRCLRVYLQQFPDGRERVLDPNVAHVRIRPTWVRLCDYRPEAYGVQEVLLER